MDIKSIINLGFSEEEATIICRVLKHYKLNIKSFIERFPQVYNEFSNINFNDEDIKQIFVLEPRIIYCKGNIEKRIKNINKKVLCGKKSDLKAIARTIIFKEETLNKKYKSLIDLGFKKEQIKDIISKDPRFITRSAKTIEDCFNFFINLGINKNKVIRIFMEHSKDICQKSSLLDENFKKLMNYGFTKEEAALLVSNLPTVLFKYLDSVGVVIDLLKNMGLEEEKIKEKLLSYTALVTYKEDNYKDIRKDLIKKGIKDDEIDDITIKATEIITYIKNVINYFYDIFYKYGFEDKDINQIIINNPKILYHSLEKIENVLSVLSSFDIKKEELIRITTMHAMIFESSIDNIKEKFSLIFKLDIYESILDNPKNLIQGCEKTFLRYNYILNELEKEIDLSYGRLIFASKQTKIPDIDELRQMYSYTHFKDNNLEERLKRAKEQKVKVKCMH